MVAQLSGIEHAAGRSALEPQARAQRERTLNQPAVHIRALEDRAQSREKLRDTVMAESAAEPLLEQYAHAVEALCRLLGQVAGAREVSSLPPA